MKLDKYNTLISEEHDDNTENGFQGNRGEAMAVTSRIMDLSYICFDKITNPMPLQLEGFVTEKGTIRHPLCKWRESDESTDQAIAFYMASTKLNPYLAIQMKERIIKAGYKTGNNNLISPSFYALLTNKRWLLNLTILGQRLLFLFPFRWNDEKFNQKKWPIESSHNSSADWMNYIHLLFYASPLVRRLVSKKKLKERVRHYFKNEPNCDWLIELYDLAIERIC